MTIEAPNTNEVSATVDLDREMDRFFAKCKGDKAFRRAFGMLWSNGGYGSIECDIARRTLKRVVGKAVFVVDGD